MKHSSFGPSSKEDTSKAYSLLTSHPAHILEIGCGKGNSTITLASLSKAKIIAIDNEQSALAQLQLKIKQHNLKDSVSTQCMSMTELNFGTDKFDVIWAEASAYIMGVEKALANWQSLLKSHGFIVFSDLVWLTDNPSQDSIEHWKNDYPDIQTINTRKSQIEQAGLELKHTFTVSEQTWQSYYVPLEKRANELASQLVNSQAISDIKNEVNLYKSRLGEFGYQFFIAQKK